MITIEDIMRARESLDSAEMEFPQGWAEKTWDLMDDEAREEVLRFIEGTSED